MKPDLPLNTNSLQETCLGVPFAYERLLTEGERTALSEESQVSLRRGCSQGCSVSVACLFLIALAAYIGERVGERSVIQGFLTALVIVPVIGLPAFVLLRANDLLKLRQANNLDLRTGTVRCYRGNLPRVLRDELTEENLESVATGAATDSKFAGVPVSLEQPVFMEVLAGSRRLWQVNSQKAQTPVILPQEMTAPLPAQAEVAAKWAQTAVQVAENVLDASQAGQRQLSPEECDELRRRAGKMWRRPAGGAALFTLWIAIPLGAHLMMGAPIRLEPLAYFIIAMAIWSNYNLAKTLLWARQLTQDADNGNVVVTRLPAGTGGNNIESLGAVIELLPISEWLWTQDGHPAPWRLQP